MITDNNVKLHKTQVHIARQDGLEHNVEYKKSRYYYNGTSEDVTITDRNNLIINIKGKGIGGHLNTSFIMRTVYEFNSPEIIHDVIQRTRTLRDVYMQSFSEVDKIVEVLNKAVSDNNYKPSSVQVTLERVVDVRDIKKHKWLYIHEDDVLLSNPEWVIKQRHPLSEEARMKEFANTVIGDRSISGVFIRIIDNNHEVNKRFIRLANKTIELPVIKDETFDNGVHVNTVTLNDEGRSITTVQVATLKEAEALFGIYKNREEAETAGNPQALIDSANYVQKTELVKANNEAIELKRAYEADKFKADQERLRLENRYNELEHSNKVLKDELDARKLIKTDYYEDRKLLRNDHFDEKSAGRKDTSEWVKMTGAIVVTALAVGTAVYKFKSKETKKD